MEKSGGGAAVTLSVKLVVCEIEPDVPMRVIVLELAGTVGAAVSVMVWGAPGLRIKDAGFAVMPAGKPERAKATEALKPLIPVVVAETCGLSTPASGHPRQAWQIARSLQRGQSRRASNYSRWE